MASGKKNYFRHHFRAHEDEKILTLIDEFGVHGYFAYFVLIERCSELLAEGEEFPLSFNADGLKRSLRFQQKKFDLFLTRVEELFDLSITRVQQELDLSSTKVPLKSNLSTTKVTLKLDLTWPNLLKYNGYYSKKSPKENKIKGNKIKEKEKEFNKLNSAPAVAVPKNPTKEKNGNLKKIVDKKNPDGNFKAQAFIKTYCELFKQRWNVNPVIRSKQSGIAKRLSTEMSLERFTFLLEAFFAMPDAWNVKQKHPLEIFVTKLNEIVVYAELGEFQTQTKSKQNDQTESVKDQLRRIDRGEL